MAFAVLFLFFLGTATALADGALGEVLDSGHTDDSEDSGLLNQVTEPVTDLIAPSGRESQDAPRGTGILRQGANLYHRLPRPGAKAIQ